MSARRRLHFPKVVIRFGVVALLALLCQAIAIKVPLGDDLPRRVLLTASYLMLLAFAAANLRRPGIAVLGLGIVLNFLPIAANGGLMPTTPETLLKTGDIPEAVEPGDWIPGTKDVLLERGDVRLWFLSDRFVVDEISGAFRAFSIGDVVLAAGLLITVGDLLLPRLELSAEGARAAGRDGIEAT